MGLRMTSLTWNLPGDFRADQPRYQHHGWQQQLSFQILSKRLRILRHTRSPLGLSLDRQVPPCLGLRQVGLGGGERRE